MKKLYFIRHGQSVLNVEGRYAGQTETPLADEGRAQAKKTGQDVKANDLKIDLIVSSPLSRALDTAKIVAKEIGYPEENIIASNLLLERNFGTGEGVIWEPRNQYNEFKNMESDEQLLVRARKALDWIEAQTADNILIVSHGGTGRALRSLVKEDFPMSHPHKLANAELHEWL